MHESRTRNPHSVVEYEGPDLSSSPAVHCSISPPSLARDSVGRGGLGRVEGGGWKGVSEVPHLGDKCVYLPRYHLFPSPT